MITRMDTSSTQETQRLSNKRPRLGSVVPMMGISCISLRLHPKEETSACGNARNVTRAVSIVKIVRAGSEKRWEHEFWVLLAWQGFKSRGILGLVRFCPRLHPAGQFQTDSKPSFGHGLTVDYTRL